LRTSSDIKFMTDYDDNFNISANVRDKLTNKHNVQINEICQCFCNREKGFLRDSREEHQSNPPTQWFVAETNNGRRLKIIFIAEDDNTITIKSAYEATDDVTRIYEKYAIKI